MNDSKKKITCKHHFTCLNFAFIPSILIKKTKTYRSFSLLSLSLTVLRPTPINDCVFLSHSCVRTVGVFNIRYKFYISFPTSSRRFLPRDTGDIGNITFLFVLRPQWPTFYYLSHSWIKWRQIIMILRKVVMCFPWKLI